MKNLFVVALVVSAFNVFAYENSDHNVDCAATAEDGAKVSTTIATAEGSDSGSESSEQ